jgi:hypothetical protein
MEIFFTMLIGFCIYYFVVKNLMKNDSQRESTDYLFDDLKQDNPNTILAVVESVDDRLICYDQQSSEYVCDGKNIEELTDNFKLRFPQKGLIVLSDTPIPELESSEEITIDNKN